MIFIIIWWLHIVKGNLRHSHTTLLWQDLCQPFMSKPLAQLQFDITVCSLPPAVLTQLAMHVSPCRHTRTLLTPYLRQSNRDLCWKLPSTSLDSTHFKYKIVNMESTMGDHIRGSEKTQNLKSSFPAIPKYLKNSPAHQVKLLFINYLFIIMSSGVLHCIALLF